MAEHDDDQDSKQPPDGAGGSGGDDLPDDPAELKKLLAQTRSQLGRVTHESKAIKKARAELAESLKGWSKIAEKHGLDPEGLDRTLSERDERDLARAQESGGEEARQMIENVKQKAARREQELQQEIERLQAHLQGVLVDDRLNQGLTKYVDTNKPGLMDGAFEILRKKIKVVADSEAPRGYSPMVNVDGADMGLEEYLAQWADTDPKAQPYLKQSQATGGGATTSGGRPSKPKYRKDMTAKEKSEVIDALGQDGYLALPWAPAPSSGAQR